MRGSGTISPRLIGFLIIDGPLSAMLEREAEVVSVAVHLLAAAQ